ncbi:MAG: HAD-IIB family hydrolase [Pseudomonadota bacterium]
MEISTNIQTQWLVVTDLDGTLLDHHSYSFSPAKQTLEKLRQLRIPVIINSSKTTREIQALRIALNNQHPFIVENGSAVLIPQDYFLEPPQNSKPWEKYWEVILGRPRAEILNALEKLPDSLRACFTHYHSMSIAELVKATGLSPKEAEQSADRYYTEPLQWLGTKEQKQTLYNALNKQGIHYTEGGRFIHVMGHTNKGSATTWLAELYRKQYKQKMKIVSLGDGSNDVDMLKAADIAVVIRSPVNQAPQFDHPCKIISDGYGPQGWAEAIEHIFSEH